MLPLEVRTDTIERHDGSPEIVGFGVDAPWADGLARDQNMLWAGWVVGHDDFEVRCIEVYERGRMLKRAKVNVPRPDVIAALGRAPGPNTVGFHFEMGVLGRPAAFELELHVRGKRRSEDETRTIRICTVKGRKHSNLTIPSAFTPIQITALGRSGTTLLMQILGMHPEVLITDFYPYEVRQAAYWMQFLLIASAPADFHASTHPDNFELDRCRIGHNPYSHPEYINQYPDPSQAKSYYSASTLKALAELAVGRIDEYYAMIAGQYGKPGARLFAEKALPGLLQSVCADLYPARKEIILTRDLRDVICSARSFNTKRNNQSFDRDKVADDFQWVDRLMTLGARRIHDAWKERGSAALHLRYEDLITQPAEQIRRVFEYLDVDADHGVVERITGKVFVEESRASAHGTSNSPQASIGRWKVDMDPELAEHCRKQLGPMLGAFGYLEPSPA